MGRVMKHIGLQKARTEEEENTKQCCNGDNSKSRLGIERNSGFQRKVTGHLLVAPFTELNH